MREPKVPAFFVPPHLLFYSLFIPFYFPFFNTLLKARVFFCPFGKKAYFCTQYGLPGNCCKQEKDCCKQGENNRKKEKDHCKQGKSNRKQK